jgi:uncharacterized protein (TIGR01568 family)
MGKSRFRLSGMMPNSWLNKLREMTKRRRNRGTTKTSYHSEGNICNSPKLKISPPSAPISMNYAPNRASQYLQSEERLDLLHKLPSQQTKLNPISKPLSPISVERKSSSHDIIFEQGRTSEELKLRPIQTKPRKSSKKIEMRSISPRCNSRQKLRRWVTQSSLEVKYSSNPEEDFMESIVEMIVETNIVELKDLEELFGCYVSLNSREHHDAIVKVFEKIRLVFVQAKYVSRI